VHLRTTNPIESTFAAVRHRTKITRGPGSRAAGLAMAFKVIESAQDHWRMVNAPHLVALVRAGATFINGKLAEPPGEAETAAAADAVHGSLLRCVRLAGLPVPPTVPGPPGRPGAPDCPAGPRRSRARFRQAPRYSARARRSARRAVAHTRRRWIMSGGQSGYLWVVDQQPEGRLLASANTTIPAAGRGRRA